MIIEPGARLFRRWVGAGRTAVVMGSSDSPVPGIFNAPMLVINGADDVHVPQHDTLAFRGRRDTDVHLLSDTGHCAVSKMPQVLQLLFEWMDRQRSR
ncbi:hypothetical protein [Streptomyces sp. NPDC001658]